MKYKIETDDVYEIQLFLAAPELKKAIDEIRNYIRNQLKHENLSEEFTCAYEQIQQKLFEILEPTSYSQLGNG